MLRLQFRVFRKQCNTHMMSLVTCTFVCFACRAEVIWLDRTTSASASHRSENHIICWNITKGTRSLYHCWSVVLVTKLGTHNFAASFAAISLDDTLIYVRFHTFFEFVLALHSGMFSCTLCVRSRRLGIKMHFTDTQDSCGALIPDNGTDGCLSANGTLISKASTRSSTDTFSDTEACM